MNWRRLASIGFRYVLPVAVIAVVGWYFFNMLRQREVEYAFRIEWLIPAALLYLMAHTIWASFWWTLLHNQGFPASYATGIRAYFISQYGKYIPGKVWVILIRIVMLGASPKDKTIVGVTATYEALTSMAAGAIVGAILIPVLNIDLKALKFFVGHDYILIVVALIPIGIGLLHRLSVRIVRRKRGPDAPHIPNMNLLVLLRGLVQASIGWMLLGISLWMTVQAIRPEPAPFSSEDVLRLTAINALAYVIGFVAFFLPGGAGAREFVLATLLTAELIVAGVPVPVAQGLGIVVALVLRLVWTLAEAVMIGLLYRFVPAVKSEQKNRDTDKTDATDQRGSE